ncbi:response regulator transcription factor [Auraticoccus monumenti]|uniref:DNA-binding response regulator, NarL/FixJ family, contains REC and HTH domains n=1 Tax=Auraticoccus monumenti TaxID=675864 RepID=A0A1G6Z5M5_9ACTN|nr:response regulator transcription factor [Auraticoccus monumenti]SDD97928.1 DNA-binding response regulator, NarL/FixJ family, contains REC and HTH domains [Auraticoccus monumenti]
MIRVLLADDQALIRRAVAELVSHEDGLEVVGEAVDGRDAVREVRRLRPDVVLMDIRMPTMDGIEATAVLCADPDLVDTRILMLTTFEEDEYVLHALRAGASGFVGKGTEAPALMDAIRTVHAGGALLSPQATRALIDRYVTAAPAHPLVAPPELELLTEREAEILVLVGRGLSNQEIAAQLYISPSTAKTHVNRMMTKLYAHDRAQLVIIAYESGLLVPGQVDGSAAGGRDRPA